MTHARKPFLIVFVYIKFYQSFLTTHELNVGSTIFEPSFTKPVVVVEKEQEFGKVEEEEHAEVQMEEER